jgi:hypothetical protein
MMMGVRVSRNELKSRGNRNEIGNGNGNGCGYFFAWEACS